MEKEKILSGKSLGGSLVAAGVGGATFFATAKAAENISFLQSRWWAGPAAAIAAGHLLKGVSKTAGTAAVGAGGALIAFSYYVNKSQAQPQQAPAQGLRAGDAGALVAGPGEAGALVGRGARGSMTSFRGGYAGRGSPSAYSRRSMAGMLVS